MGHVFGKCFGKNNTANDYICVVKNLTCILIDDDLVIRELVAQYLQLIPNVECMAVCEDAFKAKEMMQTIKPDFIILDIEMPHLSGLQFAKSLIHAPYIIFITSHLHYAADAFEVDAVDYLVKPIHLERLIRSIDKIRMLIDYKANYKTEEETKASEADGFFVKDKVNYIKILYTQVLYIESMADFVNIYLFDGTKKMVLVNLKNIQDQLPQNNFIRISRTHIINKQRIEAIGNQSVSIGKLQLPIGKIYTEEVFNAVVGNTIIKRHS
jgi:DNA-binding LytR/AlgR family response regulator